MNLKIKINMDNAAFEVEDGTRRFRNGCEPSNILTKLIRDIDGANLEVGDSWNLRDSNGNKVGEAKVTR